MFVIVALALLAWAPAARAGSQPDISETELLRRLRDDGVVQGFRVRGHFFGKLLRGEYDLPVRLDASFLQCTIVGDVAAIDRTINVGLNLYDVLFTAALNVKGSTFTRDLRFAGQTHLQRFNAEGVQFTQDVSVEPGTRIDDLMMLNGARASGLFRVSGAYIHHLDAARATFAGPVDFTNVRFGPGGTLFDGGSFGGHAIFDGARFQGPFTVSNWRFENGAWFGKVTIEPRAELRMVNTSVGRALIFSRANIMGRLRLSGVAVGGEVYLDRVNSALVAAPWLPLRGSLSLRSMNVSGRLHAEESALEEVDCSAGRVMEEGSEIIHSPNVFANQVTFASSRLGRVDFADAEFGGHVDFSDVDVEGSLTLTRALFRGAVTFRAARLPPAGPTGAVRPGGVFLSRVRFEHAADLRYSQLATSLADRDAATWETLERQFRSGGDLASANAALFERRLLASGVEEARIANFVSRVLWGYGVRPLRVLFWMGLIFMASAFAYRTQVPTAAGPPREVWRKVLGFTWNVWRKPGFGYKQAVSVPFKVLTLAQWASLTALFLFFLVALSNVSPLLNELVKKLIG